MAYIVHGREGGRKEAETPPPPNAGNAGRYASRRGSPQDAAATRTCWNRRRHPSLPEPPALSPDAAAHNWAPQA
uniref:Uncharacterized protein n=1 Tax=Oryza sativa subsp. japonica TaxID=39947 RepID=Q6Z264_ORYSJ|nr:hypothetical protein [Oryza sativa Japonica Group]